MQLNVCCAILYCTSISDLLLSGPKSAQAAEGDDVLFVCVSAIGTLGYQWEVNRVVVSAGNADFTITKHVASHFTSNTSLTIHTHRGNFNQTEVRCVILNESLETEYIVYRGYSATGAIPSPIQLNRENSSGWRNSPT